MTSAEWVDLIQPLITKAKDAKEKDVLARLRRLKRYVETRRDKQKRDLVFETYATVCDVDWSICSDVMLAKIGRAVKRIRTKYEGKSEDAMIAGLIKFREWWNTEDWRGKTGRGPSPENVVDEWQRFAMWHRTQKISGKVKSA